jgi:uncharacterized surface protein with fasciclin (FAS1) repeats
MRRINLNLATCALVAALAAGAFTASSYAADAPIMVGGAEMSSSKNIIENASSSKDHTTLVGAIKAAGLTDSFAGKDVYTVFAPTNAAFDKLPAGVVDDLQKPENKAALTGILSNHVLSGAVTAEDILKKVKDGGGQAKLKTVVDTELTAKVVDDKIQIIDGKGNVSNVTIADVKQSNGVIHVIDSILLP